MQSNVPQAACFLSAHCCLKYEKREPGTSRDYQPPIRSTHPALRNKLRRLLMSALLKELPRRRRARDQTGSLGTVMLQSLLDQLPKRASVRWKISPRTEAAQARSQG